MKFSVEKKHIGFSEVENVLEQIRNLLDLHCGYFTYSKEYFKKNPELLTVRYREHSSLVLSIITAVQEARELLEIVEENFENGEHEFL